MTDIDPGLIHAHVHAKKMEGYNTPKYFPPFGIYCGVQIVNDIMP